jgi:MFS family permease
MAHQATQHDVDVQDEAGYWELVRGNVNFRRLWTGNLISLLGDWFNTIAIYTLIVELTGSPLALGAVFITKMLPWAVAAPLAGVIVDRYNRRRLMIGTDIARAVVVLGFLLIDTPSEVPWLYVLLTAQVVIGAIFQPAKSASLPNITTPRELLTANALMSATWSTMLAVGAALGGLATEAFGTTAVFWIDSATYIVSAVFIYGTTIPQDTKPSEQGLLRSAAREITEGWQHLRAHPRIGRIALAKATWAVGGGALVYTLALVGDQIAPGALAAGIGVLFMARGIGTGVGPIVMRAVFTDRDRWPTVLGGAIIFCGLCYGAISYVPWDSTATIVALTCALVVAGHAASGGNWVLSTVMLQKRTEDRYRGRVFSTDWLFVMAIESASILLASTLLEMGWLDLAGCIRLFAGLQVVSGILWWLLIVPRERRDDERDRRAQRDKAAMAGVE